MLVGGDGGLLVAGDDGPGPDEGGVELVEGAVEEDEALEEEEGADEPGPLDSVVDVPRRAPGAGAVCSTLLHPVSERPAVEIATPSTAIRVAARRVCPARTLAMPLILPDPRGRAAGGCAFTRRRHRARRGRGRSISGCRPVR